MWTEDDIKRLKQQEQAMLRQVGKATRDEAKVIKATKAADKTAAKVERAALKANERGARAMASAEQFAAMKEWEQRKADASAARKATKDATKAWRADKETWPDAPAKGKWKSEPDYYADAHQERRGCGCFSFGFSAAGLLALLLLLALAQVIAGR